MVVISYVFLRKKIYGSNFIFVRSFGLLSNAIEIVLLIQKILAIILTILLNFHILIFSILINLRNFKTL